MVYPFGTALNGGMGTMLPLGPAANVGTGAAFPLRPVSIIGVGGEGQHCNTRCAKMVDLSGPGPEANDDGSCSKVCWP